MPSKFDEDDRALFKKFIGRVRPIKSDRAELKKKNKPKPVPKKRMVQIGQSQQRFHQYSLDNLTVADTVSYMAPGIQKKALKRLKRGFFEIEARLDLHGLTSTVAKRQLTSFIHECLMQKIRCALIIHGKGYRSPDQQPVLKNKLNHWLRKHADVLAFCSAPPSYGGTGAVLVLINS